jgi:hypothetical protein
MDIMALNPNTDALRRSAAAIRTGGPFQAVAAAAIESFQSLRGELAAQVRAGRLTPRVAREKASEAAASLRDDLIGRAAAVRPASATLADAVAASIESRRASAARPSFGTLQRETNRLLRQNLIEQQLASRASEFESRAFHRPLGGGAPAPSLEGLLAFAAQADGEADESAREWARRQLEAFRPFVHTAEEMRRIDAVCDRPEQVNPRTVARYLEALAEAPAEELDRFATEAIASRDASACVAAVLLASEMPGDDAAPAQWVQTVVEGLDRLPDAALAAIRNHLDAEQQVTTQTAMASAEAAADRMAAEARMPSLAAPRDDQVARLARAEALPVATSGQPIGLVPGFRGQIPVENPVSSDEATD